MGKKKDVRFDNPGNANDHHKKDPQNASEMMKKNLLMELAAQSKRISVLDYKRKERDTLLMEIDIKNKEIVSAKRAKKSLKAIFATKIHVDDPLFTEKLNKCNEEVLFYNQSIADAQNEIKSRSDALKEIEKGNTTKKSEYVRQEGNKVVNYNFSKRKSKFASKDALFKKKLRLTNEGKEKQHEIDKLSKKKIRETPEGKDKQREIDNLSKKKIRETPEGKEKQKEIDNLSKKKSGKHQKEGKKSRIGEKNQGNT